MCEVSKQMNCPGCNEVVDRDKLFISAMSVITKNLFSVTDYLKINGFFTAPASTKYHGNYAGGLFDHSLETMNQLVDLSLRNNLKRTRPESPYIVGMFHDLCKIDAYEYVQSPAREVTSGITIQKDDGHWDYNNECLIKGHGDKSVMILSTLMQLTEEEVLCIRYHMGAFVDKDEWNYYTRAIEKYPNVLWTHHADMIASRIVGI